MNLWTEGLLGLMLCTNLALLGTSRISAGIQVLAFQGGLLGLLTLFAHPGAVTVRVAALAAGSVLLKSYVFPRLLTWAIRETRARQEIEPFVGYTWSMLGGVLAVWVSMGLGRALPVRAGEPGSLAIPVALSTIFCGVFLIVSRRKAITQVLGYLLLENGIFVFGVMRVIEVPLLVELGVLMDVFVAVLVMSIAAHNINREFDHIDVDRLDTLRG